MHYRWSYYTGHPDELFKELVWYPFQRLVYRFKHGFDCRDLWGMDYALAKWALPRLRQFLKENNGYPCIEGDYYCDTPEAWNKTISKMIDAFQGIVDESDNWEEWYKRIGDYTSDEMRVHFEQRSEGLILFGRYLQHLWW